MALTWDTTGCSVPLPRNEDEAQQRETLLFLSCRIEVGDLTDETLVEWMVRTVLWQQFARISTPVFGGVQGLREALHRWRGLRTNCGIVSRDEWLSRWVASWVEQAETGVGAAIEEAELFAPLGSVGGE
jgi:hypothetical protein